jgi:hypothetical protein
LRPSRFAAELIPAVEQKPSFPSGAVEQTAAVFAALAAASEPLDAKGLAAQFKRVKTTEKKVGEVLASLARHGRKFGSLTIVNPFVESAP